MFKNLDNRQLSRLLSILTIIFIVLLSIPMSLFFTSFDKAMPQGLKISLSFILAPVIVFIILIVISGPLYGLYLIHAQSIARIKNWILLGRKKKSKNIKRKMKKANQLMKINFLWFLPNVLTDMYYNFIIKYRAGFFDDGGTAYGDGMMVENFNEEPKSFKEFVRTEIGPNGCDQDDDMLCSKCKTQECNVPNNVITRKAIDDTVKYMEEKENHRPIIINQQAGRLYRLDDEIRKEFSNSLGDGDG